MIQILRQELPLVRISWTAFCVVGLSQDEGLLALAVDQVCSFAILLQSSAIALLVVM